MSLTFLLFCISSFPHQPHIRHPPPTSLPRARRHPEQRRLALWGHPCWEDTVSNRSGRALVILARHDLMCLFNQFSFRSGQTTASPVVIDDEDDRAMAVNQEDGVKSHDDDTCDKVASVHSSSLQGEGFHEAAVVSVPAPIAPPGGRATRRGKAKAPFASPRPAAESPVALHEAPAPKRARLGPGKPVPRRL